MSPESTKYLREMGDQFLLTVAVLEIAYKVYLAVVLPDPTTNPLDRIGHLCGALFSSAFGKDGSTKLLHLPTSKVIDGHFVLLVRQQKLWRLTAILLLLPSAIASETICLASHGNGAHSGLSRFSDSRDVLVEHCQR